LEPEVILTSVKVFCDWFIFTFPEDINWVVPTVFAAYCINAFRDLIWDRLLFYDVWIPEPPGAWGRLLSFSGWFLEELTPPFKLYGLGTSAKWSADGFLSCPLFISYDLPRWFWSRSETSRLALFLAFGEWSSVFTVLPICDKFKLFPGPMVLFISNALAPLGLTYKFKLVLSTFTPGYYVCRSVEWDFYWKTLAVFLLFMVGRNSFWFGIGCRSSADSLL